MSDIIDNGLRELINTSLVLIILPNEIISSIDKFLPYSTGFEIECNQLDSFDLKNFKMIPDIMHIDCDSSEQRFRIPNGTKGLICLYNICEQLRTSCSLNPKSGIHYHIDFTDCFDKITKSSIAKNSAWILDELDKWNTADPSYNRQCQLDSRCWVQFQSQFKTMEVRIGEMSFDYKVLVERIIDCNRIAKKLKDILGCTKGIIYSPIDNKKAIVQQFERNKVSDSTIKNLRKQLAKYETDTTQEVKVDIKSIIDSRNVKLY